MKTCKLKIDGMHCASCAAVIDLDLEDKDGVKSSNTSYAKAETVVEFDENKLKEKDIENSIIKSGYKVLK